MGQSLLACVADTLNRLSGASSMIQMIPGPAATQGSRYRYSREALEELLSARVNRQRKNVTVNSRHFRNPQPRDRDYIRSCSHSCVGTKTTQYWVGFHKNGGFGATFVTGQSCAAPISKLKRHISHRLCGALWGNVNFGQSPRHDLRL